MRWLRRGRLAQTVQLCIRSCQLTAQRRVLRLHRLEIVFHLYKQLALEFGMLLLEFGALLLQDRVVFGALALYGLGECRALMLDGRLQRVYELLLAVARREPQSDTPICIAMLVQSFLGRLPRRAE